MKYICLFSIVLTLVSCNFNKTYSNRQSDIEEAKKISDKYYWEVKYGSNEDEIFKLFSDAFFEATDKDKLREIIHVTNTKIGKIEGQDLIKAESFIVEGSNPKSEYVIFYNVTRTDGKTQEKISMRKEDGIVKIIGYNINQDLLDQ